MHLFIHNTGCSAGCSASFSLDRSYRPPPRTSSLSPELQHLQFKDLFFNINEPQLQIQLLHLGCQWLLLLTVTGGKSKDSAITPETTQTHSHTPRPARRTAEQRDPSTQDFECSMGGVTSTLATSVTSINQAGARFSSEGSHRHRVWAQFGSPPGYARPAEGAHLWQNRLVVSRASSGHCLGAGGTEARN